MADTKTDDFPPPGTGTATVTNEPDTCRICRAEGTPDEPLFHPCRCNGTIRFVHQDCLMEWLSHAQKKHCDVCKTPYRFTKLYDPNMPKSLPWHLFVSHMSKYLFRTLLIWLRGALVITLWLAWLPYFTRSAWSIMFWISDEGLGDVFGKTNIMSRGADVFGKTTITGRGALPFSATDAASLLYSTTCPSSPLFAPTTTPAAAGIVTTLGSMFTKTAYDANLSSSGSVYWTLFRFVFGTRDATGRLPATIYNATALEGGLPHPTAHGSLLSEVDFLRNLTRYPFVNRTIITILEGQAITLLVIFCFILLLLVRDYVLQMQQQRDALRAALVGAANNRLALANELANERMAQPLAQVPEAMPQLHEGWAEPEGWPGNNFQDEGIRGGGVDEHDDEEAVDEHPAQNGFQDVATQTPAVSPPLPSNQELVNNPGETGAATVQDYLSIYRDAEGDPDEIRRLARERNVEDKLEYWIQLTKQKQRLDRDGPTEGESSTAGDISGLIGEMSSTAQPPSLPAASGPDYDDSDSHSLKDRPDEGSSSGPGDSGSKGKGKAPEDRTSVIEQAARAGGSPLRPRANTDGPKPTDTQHPLANNNWSFPDDRSASPGLAAAQGPVPGDGDLPQDVFGSIEGDTLRDEEADAASEPPVTNQTLWPSAEDAATQAGNPQENEQVLPPDTPGVNMAPPQQQADPRVQPARRPQGGLLNYIADFMWQGVEEIDPAELAAVNLLDEFGNEDAGLDDFFQMEGDQEDMEAALDAGLDLEAVDEAEELEGILELLGVRGPLAGLFQNGIFCAVLVCSSIFLGVFLPYNFGRITLWMVANPIRLVRLIFSLSKLIQDFAVAVFSIVVWPLFGSMRFLAWLLRADRAAEYASSLGSYMYDMAVSAVLSIRVGFDGGIGMVSTYEMRHFSASSHEALLSLKANIALAFAALARVLVFPFTGDLSAKASDIVTVGYNATVAAWDVARDWPDVIVNPNSWVVNISLPEPAVAVDLSLSYWDAPDRFWAIISGHVAATVIAALYLRAAPLSSSEAGQAREAGLINGLNQASGVMKVILIIGIEMLIFPLYCGMLLDVALLPLFEDASITSRILFTVENPVTSAFVHWFVGTGYMFHFALFVSMCRKIMRKGVLYFIRDPDDPDFHPVRDVLERSVTTQLRKIMFSAFVYGALVMICLGGVVWGLALSLPGVLPIHYSSNEPVLEFPVDLLFYNFLMPLAVNFFKPSDGLHVMYTWWFRKCARALRLTWFLFGERRVEEEGRLVLAADSPHNSAPWRSKLFLELDPNGNVVPKTWSDTFDGGDAKPSTVISSEELILTNVRKINLVQSGQLIPDGRFVRTPASDQIKLPKGQPVFLEVDENNQRTGNQDKDFDDYIYSTNLYQLVYVPPHFRARVSLFILLIWIFAATTGVSITIVPLVFGRTMFRLLLPEHVCTNDIYAFSIGVYILAAALYAVFRLRPIAQSTMEWVSAAVRSAYNPESVRRVLAVSRRVFKVSYAYFFLFIAFPLMVSSLVELYAILPLHEFMYSSLKGDGSPAPSPPPTNLNPRHTIRVMQTWTLGLLYLKLSSRVIALWFDHTILAAAVRAVLRRGWLDPDVAVLTRAFVVPGLVLWVTATVTPVLVARFIIANCIGDAFLLSGPEVLDAYLIRVYRLSFPLTAFGAFIGYTLWCVFGWLGRWKMRIRDEVYLIGERLHNFGANAPPKIKGTWRAGQRL